ncbi:hypothetical protein ACUV84_030593 [Puccinellia chinampoensis]
MAKNGGVNRRQSPPDAGGCQDATFFSRGCREKELGRGFGERTGGVCASLGSGMEQRGGHECESSARARFRVSRVWGREGELEGFYWLEWAMERGTERVGSGGTWPGQWEERE